MIENFYLTEWRQQAPWPSTAQIEQDLIISKALVCLYNNSHIRNALAFRGGTALNKLFLQPPSRYSEDLDFVQIKQEGIGSTIDSIRDVLDNWLGQPKRKLTERGAKLIYRYQSVENATAKLKVEINTTEHYHIFNHIDLPFKVDSGWFSGICKIKTFQLDELMGTKLRALYQRRKGRDLFDVWLMAKNKKITIDKILEVFLLHCQKAGLTITRAIFEKSLFDKAQHEDFRFDIVALLANGSNWKFEEAYDFVIKNIIAKLPGEPWNKTEEKHLKSS